MIVEEPTQEQIKLFRLWKFKESLSPWETACLTLGLDPNEYYDDPGHTRPITDAIHDYFFDPFIGDARVELKGKFVEKVPRDLLVKWFEKNDTRPAFLYRETWQQPSKPTRNSKESPMQEKERQSLHIIIGVLLGKAGIEADDREATSKLERLIQNAGASLDKDTIRKHMRAAAETLNEETET